MIVVGEGLVDADGNYVHASSSATDAFGHSQLGGAGDYLRELVETNPPKTPKPQFYRGALEMS